MKPFLTTILLLLFSNCLFSQNPTETESITNNNTSVNYANVNFNLELSALIQSVNFETTIFRTKSNLFQLNGRVGVGYFYLDFLGPIQKIGGIVGLNFLIGKHNSHFEASIGWFLGFEKNFTERMHWPVISIGYRYQKPEGGFFFKPHIGTTGPGFGVGYAF
jgi:hypothetical protein